MQPGAIAATQAVAGERDSAIRSWLCASGRAAPKHQAFVTSALREQLDTFWDQALGLGRERVSEQFGPTCTTQNTEATSGPSDCRESLTLTVRVLARRASRETFLATGDNALSEERRTSLCMPHTPAILSARLPSRINWRSAGWTREASEAIRQLVEAIVLAPERR
jgi:hypothetical protein